ncbi:hypothetical protein DOTSEDRAFT_68922 [Dothistroma septosporum NZE10]|uniref:RNA helicase n=1 Tax=Dothistroma septosporum (strain NZE10 / CBS 128990) TaxID=675120 RepID=N1Q3E9_DOTSN|nr:hypothetical protein DOTSEDRAFT_68922 [Dothistroma septosporum NZE10]
MAKAKLEKSTLGNDAAIPAISSSLANGTGAITAPTNIANGAPAVPLGDAKISSFGLNKSAGDAKTSAAKATATLDDDEDVQRKFRKLPDLPQNSVSSEAALTNDQEDQAELQDDLRSDEEEAEAAREAAQRRAEAQTEQADVEMADDSVADQAVETSAPAPAENDPNQMELDEEVDPLDAFMSDLGQSMERAPAPRSIGKRANRGTQLFDEDDGPDLDAVGDNPEDLLSNPKRKKKEVPNVDHSKIEYETIRKNFYNESIEMAEMSQEDVDKLRADLDNIQVRGLDVPKPVTKWSQCGFGAAILEVIRDQKFESPTSIQCQALPAIMSGRDTIGIAKTGSGKTLAFVLPMFRHIKDQRPVANLEGPIGIIMAPTRELAVQIHRECKPYLKALSLRGVCAYGGAPIKDQIAELKRGAEVVVCTPGRMIDLLAANAGRVTNLSRVTYVVMDEADRMFDMGFEPQITKILGNIRPDRQTVTFSATFPKKMESLARKALNKPVEIVVGGRSVVAAEITQLIEVRTEEMKFRRVLQLLGDLHERDEDARSLIFVERQETADDMLKELGKKGYPCVSVHGGREQIDRDQAILDFKAGIIPIMVATSVAARGLDVKQLKLVINYDSPNHGEDYVHRAGRTGRAGQTGTAVTLLTPEQERFAPFLVRALQDSKQEVPQELQEMAANHKKKVQSGEATNAGSGFGGKGIERLDAARAADRARERKQFKTEDEPEEEEETKDKKESEVDKLVAKAAGTVKAFDSTVDAPTQTQTAQQAMDQKLQEHLDNAKQVTKVETPGPSAAPQDTMSKAAAAAAAINARLGTRGTARPGAPIDNRGPDAGAFHATLEINDFPQKARWAVTNRTNVAKILEATGTSITSKGNYYGPGTAAGPEDPPKLYILVEGDTEIAVSSAMKELSRHLTEGTLAAQDVEARGGTGGRYKVV